MKRIVAVLLVSLSACTAQMIETRGTTSLRNAPTNERAKGGVVRYGDSGAKSIRDARRQSAYDKMSAYCGGPYKIVNESNQVQGSSSLIMTAGAPGAYSVNSQYRYIDFDCE